MHHHRPDADQVHQHHVLGESLLEVVGEHRMPPVLDHEGLAPKTLDEGQRLDQDLRALNQLFLFHRLDTRDRNFGNHADLADITGCNGTSLRLS